MKNNHSSFWKNFSVLLKYLFGIFVLYYLIFFLTPKISMNIEHKNQLDSLNIVIKQLHSDNLKLENKIQKFELDIQDIDSNISRIKNQKTLIKEYYHEKINSVDKLTIPEIDSFFTNRYK
jgi:hypothetical protein